MAITRRNNSSEHLGTRAERLAWAARVSKGGRFIESDTGRAYVSEGVFDGETSWVLADGGVENDTTTTDATAKNVLTYTVPNGQLVLIEVTMVGRHKSGAGNTNCAYKFSGLFSAAAGSASQVDATVEEAAFEADAATLAQFAIAGAIVGIQAQGKASVVMDWHAEAKATVLVASA